MDEQDWSLAEGPGGTVEIRFGDGETRNLGPRDEALMRFADFFGDEGLTVPAGFTVPPDGGVAE